MMSTPWQIKKTAVIDQPIELVYDYLSRFHNIQEWDPSVLQARMMSSGKPVVGSRFQLTLLFGWKRIPMTYEIVSLTPRHEISLKGRAPGLEALDRIRFEKIPAGTRLVYSAEVAFDRPPGKTADNAFEMLFRVNAGRAIKRLQRMLSGAVEAPRLTPMTRLADQAILPGLAGFTRVGFMLGKNRRPVASALYAGRTMVITGGTSGIGRAAALALYRRGAHLVVVGRNGGKLENLSRELLDSDGGGRIATEMGDLSLMADIRQLAARLNRCYGHIDVLINNAGALFNHYELTSEGIEKTLATDLLGPYLLTRLLLPALRAAKSARVINVASGGMYTQGIRPGLWGSDTASFDGPAAYARAKRGLVILTGLWAREQAPSGISVHAMHPGWVATPGLEKSLPAFYQRLRPWLRTPAQGADTIVWLAASPDAARASGQFWLDRKIRATHVFPHTHESSGDRADLVRTLERLSRGHASSS